ncbi:MAG: hypothetical protein LBK23_06905 [Oscillospiraceae bacterium]|jgi:Fe-S-cluster formation regulator IscX/YfhJ|nr:hypothetical protein [Oscillospiraceae bacterium]
MSYTYEVTLELEVLREFAASIDASYSRYMRKHGIDWKDEENPIAAEDREIVAAKGAMLRCDTLEELQPFGNRLEELRDRIKELEDMDKCSKKSSCSILTAGLQTR